jgi:diguanylate cyclase (GGDEF)-like protein/PAS domain S-box-containing protein
MNSAFSDRLLPTTTVPHSEVKVAIDMWVSARLKKILPALAAVYLAISVAHLFIEPHESSGKLKWLTYMTGVVILGSWSLLRRSRIRPNRVHLCATVIGTLIAIRSLVEFSFTLDAADFVAIVLLLIGSATTLLAWRGFAFMVMLSVAGWTALAPQNLPLAQRICWSFALLLTVAVCCLGIHLRITKHYQAQRERLTEEARKFLRKRKNDRFELAVQGTEDGLWYWDLKSEVFEFSPSWANMLGFEEGELDSNVDTWLSRVHPGYVSEVTSQLSAHLQGQTAQFRNEHRLLRKDGTYLWVLVRATAVRDEAGEAMGLAGSQADITSLIGAEKRLLQDSFLDKLTNLPNRDFLMSCLQKKLAQQKADRNHAPRFAVMFLDLDRFKIINDSLGHPVGDQLLSAVASRLRNCARPNDVVARFGGDEFVVLLDGVRDSEEAVAIGNRMQSAVAAPFQIGGREVASGASIGIVLSCDEIDNTDDLLRYADIAMYRAKSNGKGRVQLFDEGMRSYATKLCDLQNDLRQALARQQFVLHYQPTFSIGSGKIVGVEALIRWQRSKDELIAPADFIPLAEETDLISEIGDWALRTACAQNSAWQRAGVPPVRMAVNLSTRQLGQKEFPQSVLRILKETNLQSNWLELELTESALMDGLGHAPANLERLGTSGIRIAIDDFGTGYSSLNYLRQFNFNTLKMDRCFVSDLATNGKGAAVAKGLITLAHNLDLSVIAEGVERRDQLAFLASHNCDQAQGFLAGRPVCAEQLVDLLRLGDVKGTFNYDGFDPAVDMYQLAYHAGNQASDHGSRLRTTKDFYPASGATPVSAGGRLN